MYRYTFSLSHNIDKNSYSLCFWAPDPLIKRIYKNLLIKGLEPKNKSHLNLYEKVYLMFYLDGLYIVAKYEITMGTPPKIPIPNEWSDS